jgi:hypothetical protein
MHQLEWIHEKATCITKMLLGWSLLSAWMVNFSASHPPAELRH